VRSCHSCPLNAEASHVWSGASSVTNMPLCFTCGNLVCLRKQVEWERGSLTAGVECACFILIRRMFIS